MEDLEVGDSNLKSHYSCLAVNINYSLGTSVSLCGLSEWTNFIFLIAWWLDSKRGYPGKAWARWQLNCFSWPKTDSHIVLLLPYSTSQDTHKVLPSSKTPLPDGGVVIWEEIWRVYRTRNIITVWPSNPTPRHIPWGSQNWKRHMYPVVHRSNVYNS